MLIVANWKAYIEDAAKAKKLVAAAKRLSASSHVDIVIAPPAPYLGILAAGNRSKLAFASQDVSAVTAGAATGEVTAHLLKDLGVRYAIVGHSERRAMGETDELVARKVQHAIAHGIIPILCVGERDRDPDGRYLSALRAQMNAVLSVLSHQERLALVIAYEPIWAIGKSALSAIAPSDLTEMMLYIRKVLSEYLPGKSSAKIPILYGGSAEPSNVRSLAEGSGIDGFLVGHASADQDSFAALVKAVR